MRDIGCYAISLARFLIGKEPVRLVSQFNKHPDFGTDELSTAILDFGCSKATFSVATGSSAFQKVDIVGTAGHICVHLPFNAYADSPAKITVATAIGHREISIDPADQYGLMIHEFADAVLNKKSFLTEDDDAVLNQKVIDTVFKSADSGYWETID